MTAESSKSLIVTADDFGFDSAVNAAVLRAYREGFLGFASLMVLRPGAKEAAAMARDNPGLGVGLHLELCAESPATAGLRYALDAKARAGVESEIRAQIETLLLLGVNPTHADGHCNIHVHPVIFPALCRLCREYGIPRVRLPSGELSACLDYPGTRDVLSPLLLSGLFAAMALCLRPSSKGLCVPRTWGLLRSGRMSEDYLLWLAPRLPKGLTELYFHPREAAAGAMADGPTSTHQSVAELEALLSPRARRALVESGVEFVSAARRRVPGPGRPSSAP